MNVFHNFQGSKYYPEANYSLIDVDEIADIFDVEGKDPLEREDAFAIHYLIDSHENYHAMTNMCGDSLTMVKNTLKIIDELFDPLESSFEIEYVVKLQAANRILLKNSRNIQEAMTAYAIDLEPEIKHSSTHMKLLKKYGLEKKQSVLDNRFQRLKDSIKEEILDDSDVRKVYEKFQLWAEKFKDADIVFAIIQFCLDISHTHEPEEIIAKYPETDAQWRLDTVLESLESLDRHNKLYMIPGYFKEGFKSPHTIEGRLKFENFVGNKLTGIKTGFTDYLKNGIDDRIMKIQYNPRFSKKTNIESKFEMYYPKTTENDSLQIILKHSEYHVWSGFRINNGIMLVPNIKLVEDKILEIWLIHFYFWTLKNCILYQKDIDSEVNKVLNLKYLKDEKTLDKAKALQKVEFEKSQYYDMLLDKKVN